MSFVKITPADEEAYISAPDLIKYEVTQSNASVANKEYPANLHLKTTRS